MAKTVFAERDVWLPELVRDKAHRDEPAILEGAVFNGCTLFGPAVLFVAGDDVLLTHCDLGAAFEQLWWELTNAQKKGTVGAVGGVGVRDCEFRACAFKSVGWTGPANVRDLLRAATR